MAYPSFAVGDVLAANDMNAIGLWKINPTSVTNGTIGANGDVTIGTAVSTVTLNGVFSSAYDMYQIRITGGGASATADMWIQLGTATTGYNYSLMYMNYNSNTLNSLSASNVSTWAFAGAATTDVLMMNCTIYAPHLTEKSSYVSQNAFSGGVAGLYVSGGTLENTTSYTDLKIGLSSGTMTGGKIRIYGCR